MFDTGISYRSNDGFVLDAVVDNDTDVLEVIPLSTVLNISTLEVFVWVHDGVRFRLQTFADRNANWYLEVRSIKGVARRVLVIRLPKGRSRVRLQAEGRRIVPRSYNSLIKATM